MSLWETWRDTNGTYVAETTILARKITEARQPRVNPWTTNSSPNSQGLPVIATQPAKEKPDVRKESVSLAGPGLILVRLRGTEHASANLRLPIANAKRFSLSSGAGKLHARIVAAFIVAVLEAIHSLKHFLSILFRSHPQSHQTAATSRQRLRSPRHTTVPVSFSLTRAHIHTHTTLTHSHLHTCRLAVACDYRLTRVESRWGFSKNRASSIWHTAL